MPSVTPEQQRLFGWALSCKRGETNNCPENIKKLADSMTEKQLEEFASTKYSEMSETELLNTDVFEKEEKKEVPSAKLKPSDVPPVSKDVKTPPPVVANPAPPPGYVAADKRNPPGFFTPSLFKRPGDKTAKRDRRFMDFGEFLKRINYRTHDDVLQKGRGVNLTGGKNS